MASIFSPSPPNLGAIGLFKDLSASDMSLVISGARVRHLDKGAGIFNQGDPDVRAHAVISGGVRITQSGGDGAQVVIRFINPGEIFGTVALFTDGRYPADATTLADTIEVSWSEADLLRLVQTCPPIAVNLVRIIGLRLSECQDRVRELATQPAAQRLAHALIRLARQAGRRTAGEVAIGFPLKRKDIADISGVTLYTASRILTRWERAGLMKTRDQRLTIRFAEIEAIANGA